MIWLRLAVFLWFGLVWLDLGRLLWLGLVWLAGLGLAWLAGFGLVWFSSAGMDLGWFGLVCPEEGACVLACLRACLCPVMRFGTVSHF